MRRYALLWLILTFVSQVHSQDEIISTTSTGSATLGGAYQTDKEAFVGQECMTGESELVGTSTSTFALTQSMKETALASELGFSAGGRGRFGAVEASASANFFTNSISNAFTTSSIYSASYNFPGRKLKNIKLSEVGKLVRDNDERWNQTCGNGYVAEIHSGGKLFFSIVVEFSSASQKDKFDADFNISGPLAGASAKLHSATDSFGRNVKVRINALQIGGDVSQLTALFPASTDGSKDFLDCTLGKFESCAAFLSKALDYATNVKTGFPSQLKPSTGGGGATFSGRVVPYTAAGIYPKGYPGLVEATLLARRDLSNQFEKMFRLSINGDRLLQQRLTSVRRESLQKERAKVKVNLTALLAASKTCYETPAECPKAVNQDLQVSNIDEAQFAPESFMSICSQAAGMAPEEPLKITVDAMKSAADLRRKGQPGGSQPLDCAGYEGFLTRLKDLNLGPEDETTIPPLSPVSDLTPFSPLLNLEALAVPFSHVTDLSPLTTLPNLKQLEVAFNPISDLSPLETMSKLEVFGCARCKVSDLAPLASLTNLNRLDLSHNRIIDVTSLGKLARLQFVVLDSNIISDLSTLGSLKGLQSISAMDNAITTLSSFNQCTGLQNLNLNNNGIADFEGFQPPPRLKGIWLAFNPVMNDQAKVDAFQKKFHVAIFPVQPPQK